MTGGFIQKWLVCGAVWCAASGAFAQSFDPSAAADAEIERKKILKAADQIDLVTSQQSELQEQIRQLKDLVTKLQDQNDALTKRISDMEKARAAEKDALLKEVSKIVASGSTSVPQPAPPSPSPRQEGYEHIVQAGQSLWAIAKAFQDQGVKVSVEDIKQANGLSSNVLHAGQKLFIPAK